MRFLVFLPLLAALVLTTADAREKKKDDGFVSIFDGKSLDGWHVSAKSGHSGKSKNKTGGQMGRHRWLHHRHPG